MVLQMRAFFPKLNFGSAYLIVSFLVGVGFIIGETDFAKLGIPLPLRGNSVVANPSLFVFEIFLLFTFLLVATLFMIRRISFLDIGKLQWIMLIYLLLLLPKVFLELGDAPLTVIRNSSFVWYLSLPILVGFLPITGAAWEKYFWNFSVIVVLWLALAVVQFFGAKYYPGYDFLGGTRFEFAGIRWSLSFGIYSTLFFSLISNRKIWPIVALFFIGLGFGVDASTKFSRTNLMGCGITVIVCMWVNRFYFYNLKKILFRILFIFAVAATTYKIIISSQWYNQPSNLIFTEFGVSDDSKGGLSDAPNSLVKSVLVESGSFGMVEGFRYYMYKDAWELFTKHPWLGIPYSQQVVHRFFVGGERQFLPNTGIHFAPVLFTSPISGPHNSYLNALARVGVLGFGFFLLHCICLYFLFKNNLYSIFFALMGGVLYSIFNVGLEGSARSYFLLLALGAVIRVLKENDAKNFQIYQQ